MQAQHELTFQRPFPGPGWYGPTGGRRYHYYTELNPDVIRDMTPYDRVLDPATGLWIRGTQENWQYFRYGQGWRGAETPALCGSNADTRYMYNPVHPNWQFSGNCVTCVRKLERLQR